MEIIALISSYQETMLDSCIESAASLDKIFVFEGPTTYNENILQHRDMPRLSRLHVPYILYSGRWKSDADKRTEMLKEAQAWNYDAWGIWIDGDEILLYGEYLRDHTMRASYETGAGGYTLRIVEYDGSVAQCHGKIIKLDAISRYIMSSYEVELASGLTVALPNVPICSAGGIPIGDISERDDPKLATNRPPVIGEPHLLHRHGLRNPNREAPRLHDKEAESFQEMLPPELRDK